MDHYLLPLVSRENIAEGTMTFSFDLGSGEYSFRAGQHAELTLLDPPHTDAKGNLRVFSFTHSPKNTRSLFFATRMRDSAFKKSLAELLLGTKVKVSRAMGNMTLHKDDAKPAVFLAGGIGITPMRSIIEWAFEESSRHQLFLFHANRTIRSMPFFNDFEQWARSHERFTFIPTLSDEGDQEWHYERGRVDHAMIAKYVEDMSSAIYYLAGPPPMVATMWQLLVDAGISEDVIKSEEFGGY
ncbi:MAG: oxidoreductase [Candidatus Harrisonbacteria bacterium CG10_big_fil_rev_8_21_14_0_10_42_17]|uniref:Oxidoreductase n=1 Tax=Candidatus Harrisonbacteria bacterium CG10_big_fil_rev_8_21_14_0_10_42_17 TaxID=1974584 RepID=A0A2M6WHR9_9BACT|nr:MAG: oxidoreductase [Candidatus Harrisonbacteria bacterium CG10_big_fil_rev_8_21_14_0_10_42_17]